MAGGQSPVFACIGQMGSGKSHYVRELIKSYQNPTPKYLFLVVLNTSKEFSEFCAHKERFNKDRLKATYTPEALKALIQHYGSVHFEVPNFGQPLKPFLSALYQAIFELGEYEADGCRVLFVTDETPTFFNKMMYSLEANILCTESRKYGIHMVFAFQKIASTSVYTIHQMVLNAVNIWAIFPTTEVNNRKHIEATLSASIPDPGLLAMPIKDRAGPEYIVIDRLHNRMGVVRRRPDNTRFFEELRAV
ncbi:hypothetical protein [Deinococcus roseus]|uniref:Zona occludens toxin N-terminal domain-containing protein n=1 Tax=Deinococcus roseus TaxID=392414 RepID=A0ABQ2DFX0_9DEIO|nr:hypothetical protein [Deinococcus roseus]GGJ56562.1 hypothetical protein GCM10008938_48390 [Deinococcus roseus]